MSIERRNQIVASLRDKEYRDAFVSDHINARLALQVRQLRERLGWSQRDLGQRAGMAQERVSLLEDPDYGRHTLATLKRLAAAFDVALIIRFVPVGEFAEWAAMTCPFCEPPKGIRGGTTIHFLATDLCPRHLAESGIQEFETRHPLSQDGRRDCPPDRSCGCMTLEEVDAALAGAGEERA